MITQIWKAQFTYVLLYINVANLNVIKPKSSKSTAENYHFQKSNILRLHIFTVNKKMTL